MLDVAREIEILVLGLRGFASGSCTFDEVERIAFDIRDRWSDAVPSALPPESEAELPLWTAIWDITSSCRDSLVAETDGNHPVLQHIRYLEGSDCVPNDWVVRRP